MQHEDVLTSRESVSSLAGLKKGLYIVTKRTFDVLVSLVGILFLIPLMVGVKIAFLLTGDFHSIFFKQERIGLRGKLFSLYKFRTMKIGADDILKIMLETNEEFREEYERNKKIKNDPRITKVGRVLRKLSLDEFPQFINIFKGDMSFVGNRPYLPRERNDMGHYFNEIVSTKPGLTGYWQTRGRSNTSFQKRLRMEQEYSRIQSLKLDLNIIFKTILQLIKRDGAI